MDTQVQVVERNMWGAIKAAPQPAREILCDAIIAGLLEEEYCDVDRKHRGSALNYGIYDYTTDVILIQARHTTCTKWGNSPQKDYYILLRVSGEVVKFSAPHKMAIVRASKLGLPAGKIIEKICKTADVSELFVRFCVAPKMGQEVAA